MTHKYAQVNPIITGWNKKTVIKLLKIATEKQQCQVATGCYTESYN
jgi:hypothetical protein